ncbi:hypothetical protein [Methylobacterium sp. JK268]
MSALSGARTTLLAAVAAAGLAAFPAAAAPAVDRTPAKAPGRSAAVRDVTVTRDVAATATAPEDAAGDAGCTTARKRLFVEGEGWIVRRVTTCR